MIYPDPDPALNFLSSGSRSGSYPYYLSMFRNYLKKTHLKFNQKEESTNYLSFFISYYSPTIHAVQNSQAWNEKYNFYVSALSFFAGSGSGTIIPDPDPCGSGSAKLVFFYTPSPPLSPPPPPNPPDMVAGNFYQERNIEFSKSENIGWREGVHF